MKLATVLSAFVLILAGCGDSEEGSGGKANPASTSAPATSGGGEAAKTAENTIKDFEFDPDPATVASGGTITWTNEDSANHNVIFDDKSVKSIDNLRQGQSGKVTFDQAGSYAYVCSYHPGMDGTVEVQ